MDSNELYTLLQRTLSNAENVLRERGVKNPGILIYFGERYVPQGKIEFHIEGGGYGSAVSVKGQDFFACLDEFLRRHSFAESQKHLQLGAPTIEPDPILTATEAAREIPF